MLLTIHLHLTCIDTLLHRYQRLQLPPRKLLPLLTVLVVERTTDVAVTLARTEKLLVEPGALFARQRRSRHVEVVVGELLVGGSGGVGESVIVAALLGEVIFVVELAVEAAGVDRGFRRRRVAE